MTINAEVTVGNKLDPQQTNELKIHYLDVTISHGLLKKELNLPANCEIVSMKVKEDAENKDCLVVKIIYVGDKQFSNQIESDSLSKIGAAFA